MGAAESTDIHECSLPLPAHSKLFVVRNGRYEPQDWQNLMPNRSASGSLDFDGFAEHRETRHGRRVARPPEMRQAPLLQNPASVRRDSFATHFAARTQLGGTQSAERSWSAWSCGDDGKAAAESCSQSACISGSTEDGERSSAALSFTFDAVDAVTVSVYLLAKEIEELDNRGIASRVWLASQDVPPGSLSDTCSFEPGLGQVYRSPPLDLAHWRGCASLEYDAEAPKHVPVAVKLEVAGKDGGPPNIQYTYVSLHVNEGTAAEQPWSVQVYSQKLQYGEQVFVLHELFGVSSALTDEVDPDIGGGSDCIICFAEPRDTAVLPCRHMCFCSHCAGVARLQCERCPVCRQKVSSLLQLKRNPKAPKDLALQLDKATA